MKNFLFIFLIIIGGFAQARNLIGALNTPMTLPEAKSEAPQPAASCFTINTLGFQIPTFASRSEIFKTLKIKNLLSQDVTTPNLQVLKDAFMQSTSVYKNNFDVDSNSSPVLVQSRARLLGAVGYNEKRLDQSMKAELTNLATIDPRWKAALQKLTCVSQNCKSAYEVMIAYDKLIAGGKNFKKDLEAALLEQESEQVTVDEMLGGKIIPSERARLRLFSALLSQLGIASETRWNCSKTATGVQFSARLEVIIGKDTWSSDTALLSDYSQKSSQLCFSSLEKLSEQCGKKGVSL